MGSLDTGRQSDITPKNKGSEVVKPKETKEGIVGSTESALPLVMKDNLSPEERALLAKFRTDRSFAAKVRGDITNTGKEVGTPLDESVRVDLGNDYSKDKKFVYSKWRKLEGADPETFQVLEGGQYSKDKNSVYIYGLKLEIPDLKTFQVLEGGRYSKDKNFVYIDGLKLEGADLKTFEVLKDGYSKDKNSVFHPGEGYITKVTGIGSKTLQDLGYPYYVKDKYSRYAHGMALEGVDLKTFQVLKDGYSKDKNSVYRSGYKLKGIDCETFEVVKDFYHKDKNSVYSKGGKLEGADPETFQALENGYSKDKNSVYNQGNKIKGADPKTFQVPKYY